MSPTPSTDRLLRTTIGLNIGKLRNIATTLDLLDDDIPGIARRHDDALIDPTPDERRERQPGWAPSDPVGGEVTERATHPAITVHNDITNELGALTRALDIVAEHARRLEELRHQAAGQLTEQQRAGLAKENAVDGTCDICSTEVAGTRNDRLHTVPIDDHHKARMCDSDRAAWARRGYDETGNRETYTDFRTRRRTRR